MVISLLDMFVSIFVAVLSLSHSPHSRSKRGGQVTAPIHSRQLQTDLGPNGSDDIWMSGSASSELYSVAVLARVLREIGRLMKFGNIVCFL